MKNTKYLNDKYNFGYRIVLFSICIILPIILFCLIITIYKGSMFDIDFFQNKSIRISLLIIFSVMFIFVFAGSIGYFIGNIRGRMLIKRQNKEIKKIDQYIYCRELPNDYGIGVNSILMNTKIENYKDIVAVILDLAARKYITINKDNDKYCIKILKTADKNLLENEKYIFELLSSNNINNIDYQKWYNYSLQDGSHLGLYFPYDEPEATIKYRFDRYAIKEKKKVILFISFILAIFSFVFRNILGINYVYPSFKFILIFGLSYLSLVILIYLINFIYLLVDIGKDTANNVVVQFINNNLIRSKTGSEQYLKLISFRNFIADFGHFVDKNPEQVIIWDRYLSYAQLFGLTKKILKTGYKKLINNSSFILDNIDDINIFNLYIDN